MTEEKVELTNADVVYTFTSKGGGIEKATLLTTKDKVALNARGKAAIGSLSGAPRSYEELNYRVVDKTDKRIVFEAQMPNQVLVRKEYAFTEGEGSNTHLLNFKITLTNQGTAKVSSDSFYIYTGAASSLRPDEVEVPAFTWNIAGDEDYFATTSFREGANWIGMGGPIREISITQTDRLRWAGVMSRFYTTLITPKEDQPARMWGDRFLVDHSNDEFKTDPKAGNDFAIHGGLSLPLVELDPQTSKSYDFRIYTGAKVYQELNAIDTAKDQPDRQLRSVMHYGWFSFISRILVAGLRMFHDWTGNWGVAIILLTVCVRSVLWPIQARSNATMKRMGLLSPKLKELQEKYKDDPQRLNTEMMKLYREYGVNPVGGCLPLLVQIPIFFGFYAVLRYAAELRGQSFLWVDDLSMPDTVAHLFNYPVNPLPLIMGVTMFLQMKLTPQPASADKTQQRIFMLMPFMFLFFCYHFASALALYWSAQNIYSIFQAQISRLWQKDPVLTKVAPAPPSGGSGGASKAKDKPSTPRLGGGSTKSSGKKR